MNISSFGELLFSCPCDLHPPVRSLSRERRRLTGPGRAYVDVTNLFESGKRQQSLQNRLDYALVKLLSII
jgi:hypothetical protein